MSAKVESKTYLEALLKENGLGVCFRSSTYHSGDSQRRLGIFPLEELTLVYNPNNQTYEHLCREHRPANTLAAFNLPGLPIAKCYPRSIFFYFSLIPENETYFTDRR